MKKLILISMMLLTVFAACKKEDEPAVVDPTPTVTPTVNNFPYIVNGASWTYDCYDSDTPGTIISQSYTITAKNSSGWCTVAWALPGFSQNIDWYVDDSIFSNHAQQATNVRFALIKKNPTVGSTYSWTGDSGGGVIVTNTRTVVSISESITVPLGTFTGCVKIHETTSQDPVYYKDYWIHPATGIVKTEGTTQADYPTIIYEALRTKI